MAFSASAFPAVDAIKAGFDKQVSAGSTVVPGQDDFSRFVSMEQDGLEEVDVFEARGSMVDALAWQLPEPAEDSKNATAPMFFGSEEMDFYETRGGLAEQLRDAPEAEMDEYESRGGIAARAQRGLPTSGATSGLPCVAEGDEYEMRGSMAAWQAAVKPAAEG